MSAPNNTHIRVIRNDIKSIIIYNIASIYKTKKRNSQRRIITSL